MQGSRYSVLRMSHIEHSGRAHTLWALFQSGQKVHCAEGVCTVSSRIFGNETCIIHAAIIDYTPLCIIPLQKTLTIPNRLHGLNGPLVK